MRHHNNNRKFGRVRKVRTGLIRSLLHNLILEERIETTEAKAKEIRPLVEKLVTKASVGTIAARRLVDSTLGGDPTASKKLIDDLGPRYKERSGGYTRITKLPTRQKDAAPMALIEFV